jgi:hypothetical protein
VLAKNDKLFSEACVAIDAINAINATKVNK